MSDHPPVLRPPVYGEDEEALGFEKQPMVRWLSPKGLAVTGGQVLLSTVFGAYADKREIQAALSDPKLIDFSDRDGLWFDWIADTGDGFNPTYTTAYALAQDRIDIAHNGREYETRRGAALVLGGDLAYPSAGIDEYINRMVGPYEAAFPEPGPSADRPLMLACAGNHDWYDGLTTFLRIFCEQKAIGAWVTEQPRSYFAAKLPHGWWLFAIDQAFDFFIDKPQLDYFHMIASDHCERGDKVILATHKPSWLKSTLDAEHREFTSESMTNLQQFEHEIVHANGLELPLALAGDIHHYDRYAATDGATQRVTSGSGGTFIHPTHNLKRRFGWPGARQVEGYELASTHPDISTSKKLRWRTLLAPYLNPSFITLMGAIMLLFVLFFRFQVSVLPLGFKEELDQLSFTEASELIVASPGSVILAVILLAALIGFTDAPQRWQKVVIGFLHWSAQMALIMAIVYSAAVLLPDLDVNALSFTLGGVQVDIPAFAILYVAVVAVIGGLLMSQLFAIYLFLMQFFWRKHPTHAFSSQRVEDYRNFLRFEIEKDGTLVMYPIKIDRVPRRWRKVDARAPHEPVFEPVDRQIECELIEDPVRFGP